MKGKYIYMEINTSFFIRKNKITFLLLLLSVFSFAYAGQNPELNSYLISGTVKNGTVPVSGAIVQLTLPWTNEAHPYKTILSTTDANGYYYFDNAELNGYTEYLSIVMNAWDNNSISYYPGYNVRSGLPAMPQTFNFNAQQQRVNLTITNPLNNSVIATAPSSSINLTSTANMLIEDGTTITSLVYTVNGQNYTAANTTGGNYSYNWTPPSALFYRDVELSVLATASNGMTGTATVTFHLNCSGNGCPNQPPTVVWNLPSQTTINQASGFTPVNIEITVTDNDGSVSSVQINSNGSYQNMVPAGNNRYTYSFTPAAYQDYPVTIKATDNLGTETLLNKTIKIVNTVFVPLPEKVIAGYAHSWENSNAPFLYFNQMQGNKYNVVLYSFIETVGSDGYTPQLTLNTSRYLTGGVFNPQLLKDDIAVLRSQDIPVLVSIGGQNGHVALETTQQKNIFIAGVKSIIDEYKFDGLDLDFEGGSMNFGAGALTDFSYSGISAYPKLKNLVDAVREIKTFYGSGFHITAAPETFYVQTGYSTYSNTAGSFLPVINNIRDELDLLMVQLYNTGSVNGLNGTAYSQATPDFLVSMSDMLIKGFNVAGTGYHFAGLPASKIIVGLPSCPAAAPNGGYIVPTEAVKALNYLRFGTNYSGRGYTLQPGGPHPSLRGVMTWSINWDAAPGCASTYEFANAYDQYFNDTNVVTSVIWNGSAWSNITGPTSQLDAIINGNFTSSANGVFTAKTLTVNSGKSFTISAATNITVVNAIDNNGTFVVESNGNLIQTNTAANTGNVIVKRNSASIQLYDYTLWSSPVASQGLQAFSPNTLSSRFYTYNPLTNLYNAVDFATAPNFAVGKGYLIRTPNTWPAATPMTFNGVFTGIPNNGDITLSGLTADTFYAVGNPYPSTINIASFYSENPTIGTLYFWRKTNAAPGTSYATATLAGTTTASGGLAPSEDIAVGQGFILKPGASTLKFTNAMRANGSISSQFLRTSGEKSRFWLNLTSATGDFCQTMIGYMTGATTGVDNAIDGRYFNDAPIALTSMIGSDEYAIQGRPLPFLATDRVPLGFKTNVMGSYTIGIDHVDGLFNEGQAIYLKDNLSNVVVNLREGNYSFSSAVGTFNSRFEIMYQNALGNDTVFDSSDVMIYCQNGMVNINTGTNVMDQVSIFDVKGALIIEKKDINATETKIMTQTADQVLLVAIKDVEGKTVTKKILNNEK